MSRTPPRQGNGNRSARRDLVENEIYDHAARLFAERGFAGTSLQDIAEAMGLTRSALYYYVKNKDELLARLVSEITEAPASALREITGDASLGPVEKLHAAATTIATLRATHPARFRMVIRSEAELPPDMATEHNHAKKVVLDELTGIVDEGIRSGHLRPQDPRIAALGIIGLCNWVSWWFHEEGRLATDAVVKQLADMAVTALIQETHRIPTAAGPDAGVELRYQDLDFLKRTLNE
jgi:AcrR family transcriptional regulator